MTTDRIDDGGPAFPHEDTGSCAMRPGISMRDYFAAKALSGLVVNGDNFDLAKLTAFSYELADAMLKARQA